MVMDPNVYYIDDSFIINIYDEDHVFSADDVESGYKIVVKNESEDEIIETDEEINETDDEERNLVIDTEDEGCDKDNTKSEEAIDNAKGGADSNTNGNVFLEEPLVCCMCGFYTSIFKHFLKHTEDHKLKIPFLKCNYCRFQCFSRHHLLFHRGDCLNRKSTRFQCSQCNFVTFRRRYLTRHIRVIHSEERQRKKRRYRCRKCQFKSTDQQEMEKHRIDVHPKKLFECTNCLFKCLTEKSLRKHKLRHKLLIPKVED